MSNGSASSRKAIGAWSPGLKPMAGAASTYAMLELDSIPTATGLSLIAVAVLVALVADLATNVTFNPARSLVADLRNR